MFTDQELVRFKQILLDRKRTALKQAAVAVDYYNGTLPADLVKKHIVVLEEEHCYKFPEENQRLDFFEDWIRKNLPNNPKDALPRNSSGSFYNALLDSDTLLIEYEDLFDQGYLSEEFEQELKIGL